MDPQEYDDIIRPLVRIAVPQANSNARLDSAIAERRAFNQRQVAINQDVSTTRARIEVLLTRMLRQQGNGREASGEALCP
jgi:hypothetical protein